MKSKSKGPAQAPSSNWKKLLPTIKATQTTTSKKRKASTSLKDGVKAVKHAKSSDNKVIPKKEDLWFDVDEDSLATAYGLPTSKDKEAAESEQRKKKIVADMDALQGKKTWAGKFVAIDCEMVGVGPGGTESALARASLVNYNGAVLLDTFVKPQEAVTDYRTFVSGVTPELLKDAMSFKEAQEQVAEIIKDRILIGHAVQNDLKALMLVHPKLLIRDTSKYKAFRELAKGRSPGLKMLTQKVLHIPIQSGSHSSVEDARFTLALYKKVKGDWEKQFGARRGLEMKRLMDKQKKKTQERQRHSQAKEVKQTALSDQSSDNDSGDSDSD
ncbi:hypothetical protein DM01DRAFT_1333780 [Hesseltinella vesiculosa]|uniref:RNA exonuclease 4 n=1 Tax=Hesseltinella vesiculosa TaxID=101127 RepID=A0A1X2GQ77_9FUNG|nr:hypothetical protein DM01DRAFT_1333780 [Hesseltinella vesiculosa]